MKRKLEDPSFPNATKKRKLEHILSISEIYSQKMRNQKEKNSITFLSKADRIREKKRKREEKKKKRLADIQRMRDEQLRLFQSRQNAKQQHKERKLSEEEIADIRDSFLSKKSLNTRKYFKPSEKFKQARSFEWDVDDDTMNKSLEKNELYKEKHKAAILFGRGKRAGIDITVQRNEFYDNLMKKRTNGKYDPLERLKRLNKLDIHSNDINWKDKKLLEMTKRDWRIFKEDFEIITKGNNIPLPLRFWNECDEISSQLMANLKRLGYDSPSPIQRQCIPIGINNRDMIGVAETGSGKTAAFSIPLIYNVKKQPKMTKLNYKDGPYALVMAPTRELAQQIEKEINGLIRHMGLKCYSLVGGIPLYEQQHVFLEGCEILVCTPGRLKQCLNERRIVLNQCKFIVLDEADKMVDLQFEKDLIFVLENCPTEANERTMFFFSATMPPVIEQISNKYLKNRIHVTIGEVGRVVDKIEQQVIFLNAEGKKRKLIQVVENILKFNGRESQIILFVNHRKEAENVKIFLSSKRISCVYYHGGKDQRKREAALEGFKSGRYQILISTDIAGRGINVLTITHVINFDCPTTIESYKHRIGRTGRMGRSGIAITFITEEDHMLFFDLKKLLIKCKQKIPMELKEHESAKFNPKTKLLMQKEEEEMERNSRNDRRSNLIIRGSDRNHGGSNRGRGGHDRGRGNRDRGRRGRDRGRGRSFQRENSRRY